MPWSSRRVTTSERMDLIALEASRLDVSRREVAIRAQGTHGLSLPNGQRLIFDGSYLLLTPVATR